MTHLQTINGEVVTVGPGQHDPGPDCYLVKELVLKDGAGKAVRFVDIVIPGAAHWMLKPGAVGRFDLLHMTYPKPMGSYLCSFLVNASCANGQVNGAQSIHKWIRSSKGAAFHFLWFGVVLMPAFGFGLLLWICAFRLISLRVPQLPGIANR